MNKQQNKVTNLLFQGMNEMYKPLPDSLTIKTSKVNGLGLFAKEGIAQGTNLGMSHFKLDETIFRTPLGGFINHSDTPNCKRSQVRIKPGFDRWSIMVIEDIEEGDELTLKYKLYDPEKK